MSVVWRASSTASRTWCPSPTPTVTGSSTGIRCPVRSLRPCAPRVAFEIDEQWETDTWRSVVVRGVVFRIRPTETTGRVVQRSARFHRLDDVTHPLHGVDLRAGDEANFPTGNDVAPS